MDEKINKLQSRNDDDHKDRKPGILAGKIVIKEDFDNLPSELVEYFK